MSRLRKWLLAAAFVPGAWAQPFSPELYSGLRWRMIGPFRGGRTVAAAGVPGQPHVFYVGANNGGVWKSTDAGRVWKPVFDDQSTGSIGALAVAPSDPQTIYVGSGEGLQRPDLSVGDGIYKSTDGGQSWTHLGLHDGQQIAAIIIDPRDSKRLFVAVVGHPYGPNRERGVFRSTDGGETFENVLFRDENTGAVDLAFDPANARTVYAVLWAARQAPWEIGESFKAPGSGLYKSTDGGSTWQPLTGGLPTAAEGLGRIGIAIAPSDPRRMYALVDAREGGVYLSNDAGAHWQRVNHEQRVWGRGSDFACVRVDPKDKDVIYIANTSTYRSIDGGKSFTAIKGAPGGDDYHTVWINPDDPSIILLASDQGAVVSLNGGETWSSWYNQPTAQFYHVITDNRFPYWVYGGQQESGSVGTASRGDAGEITFRDWHPVGVEEYGYVAPDPLNPNIIYGGKVSRYDQTTGEVQQVGPALGRGRGGAYRFVRTMPLLFSAVDPHILYLGSQMLLRTTNGGQSWESISPELTRPSYEVPASLGVFTSADPEKGKHRGVIYTIAPSYKDGNVIWVGTDDGLIHVTRDAGKTWTNVTPPALTPWSKVSVMDASHSDPASAYAAINRFRLDDLSPHIWRTHDFGKTWQEIVRGLPNDAPINTVREDPRRQSLLFAGSERAVWVSFNDGDDWSPLRLNMPATSIRDLTIHEDDLVAGTHGRSFWILDDITPLRQMTAEVANAAAHLFKPQTAMRIRWNVNTDTPLPPEEPAGQNPPDGAILYYHLKSAADSAVIEILDAAGKTVRRYSSADKPDQPETDMNVPTHWIRPPQVLLAAAGMHRFVWDLHYTPPDSPRHDYPMTAVYRNTPRGPRGVLALPGQYTVKLTVDGKSFSQPLTVKMDPRVKTLPADLKRQFDLASQVVAMMNKSRSGELGRLLETIQGTDSAPTPAMVAAVADAEQRSK
ncbi:MAG TPA: hypothetical protein VKR61_00695 [Bryobacteraceae bacterium]|nr:hypothetical protein [Bryobacteraceae bacterium]